MSQMGRPGGPRIGYLTSDLAVPFERELLGYALKTADALGIELVATCGGWLRKNGADATAYDVMRRAREERWSFLDAVVAGVFTVPGDGGAVDFAAALKPIAEAGYSGWVICEAEQDPAKAHPLTYAKKGYANLKAVCEQVGFKLA